MRWGGAGKEERGEKEEVELGEVVVDAVDAVLVLVLGVYMCLSCPFWSRGCEDAGWEVVIVSGVRGWVIVKSDVLLFLGLSLFLRTRGNGIG